MGWIEFEASRFFCPDGADVFAGCETFEGLESSSEVVGMDEVGERLSQLLVSFVEEALEGSVFEGAIHAFDLAVGPGMLGLGQARVDAVLSASELEGMGHEHLATLDCQPDFGGGRTGVSRRSEVGAVIGRHRVDLVRNGLKQGAEEIASHAPGGLSCTWTKANFEVRSMAARR
jgi:hypothetical protein